MTNKVFRTMVVTVAAAPMARALASALPAGMGMFVAAYSPTGAAPATHFVSEGWIDEPFALALGSPEALVAMLADEGHVMPMAQARALLSQATVSDLTAGDVLASMGLVPVGEP